MKIITLVPVKNEAWILPYSLKNFSSFSDYVIVADQNSTDETLAICETFEKVRVIKNPYIAHTNQIRWLLLDEARKIEGNNLIIYLDADELLSPCAINDIMKRYRYKSVACGFSAQWIQLVNSYDEYRIDGVWKNSNKQFAFIDDREIDYDRRVVTNDHSNRIPPITEIITMASPILHLQYLARKRSEIKQVFYMCAELLQGISPRRINNRYSVARLSSTIKIAHAHTSWYSGITLPPFEIFESEDTIKKNQIYELLRTRGVLFFEPLDIWREADIRKFFLEKTGRIPRIKTFPEIIVIFNDMKNKIKNAILAKL